MGKGLYRGNRNPQRKEKKKLPKQKGADQSLVKPEVDQPQMSVEERRDYFKKLRLGILKFPDDSELDQEPRVPSRRAFQRVQD